MQEFYLLGIIFLFVIKHFLADFALQVSPYLYAHKADMSHPGGFIHACIHTLGTFLICDMYTFWWGAALLGFFDGIIHYIIDYLKARWNETWELEPRNWGYWILLGADQSLHYMTYLLVVAMLSLII